MNASRTMMQPMAAERVEETSASQSARPTVATSARSLPMSAVFTLVVWGVCVTVGVLGLALPYTRPKAPPPEPEPLVAQKLEVQLTVDPVVQEAVVAPDPNAPPPPPDAVAQPQLPTPVAVAQPSPAIAFAVPVEGPVRIVEAKQAAHVVPPTAVTNTAPVTAQASVATQALVYGQGEGKQPAPEYPDRAKREGQEGTVGVVLLVGENGRVVSAEAKGCPWELLNNSAVRTVRNKWRFKPGPTRAYEVAIRFELTNKK